MIKTKRRSRKLLKTYLVRGEIKANCSWLFRMRTLKAYNLSDAKLRARIKWTNAASFYCCKVRFLWVIEGTMRDLMVGGKAYNQLQYEQLSRLYTEKSFIPSNNILKIGNRR